MRTYWVNQIFRFVEGIWLNRKSQQIRLFSKKAYFISYVRNMFWATILYKYHEYNMYIFLLIYLYIFIFLSFYLIRWMSLSVVGPFDSLSVSFGTTYIWQWHDSNNENRRFYLSVSITLYLSWKFLYLTDRVGITKTDHYGFRSNI